MKREKAPKHKTLHFSALARSVILVNKPYASSFFIDFLKLFNPCNGV